MSRPSELQADVAATPRYAYASAPPDFDAWLSVISTDTTGCSVEKRYVPRDLQPVAESSVWEIANVILIVAFGAALLCALAGAIS